MDNVSWYEYLITNEMGNLTTIQKLEIDYWPNNINGQPGKHTDIQQISMYDYRRATGWSFDIAGGKLSGDYVDGLQNGTLVHYGLGVFGRDNLLQLKNLDISTRFDAVTDSTMKPLKNETISFNGEWYDCLVYEVHEQNDTFMIWHNSSLPLPPKIVAYYDDPTPYLCHEHGVSYTGSCTYDLLDWGANQMIPYHRNM